MTFVVGYAPDERSRAVLLLAAMLARSAETDLVVCAVVPTAWPVGPARVDAEFRAYVTGEAQDALDHARDVLPSDVPAQFVVHHARSAATGVLEVADEQDAQMVVLGSSSTGAFGHVAFGGVTDRLRRSPGASRRSRCTRVRSSPLGWGTPRTWCCVSGSS